MTTEYLVKPIGIVRSELLNKEDAPKQGDEGAPEATLEIYPDSEEGLEGIKAGDEIIILTWLHAAKRDMLKVHPRGNPEAPITGVFATRSPHRPNPIGLHRVSVVQKTGNILKVAPLEAIDGTPIVDLKPVLPEIQER